MKNSSLSTSEVLNNLGRDYRLIIVGDASMSPGELMMPGGIISWEEYNEEPGIIWLQRLAAQFKFSVWLNPVPGKYWQAFYGSESISLIRRVFPMFELTVDGLEQAVKGLKAKI